jgi:hypothetical protein
MSLPILLENYFTVILTSLGPLILASLVWMEQKTGLVLKSFAFYDKYSQTTHFVLSAISLSIILYLLRICLRPVARLTREDQGPVLDPASTKSSPGHRRTKGPEALPGMDFGAVERRWKTQGMEDPFLPPRAFGDQRQAEASRIKTNAYRVPTTSFPPSPPATPVHAAFGNVGFN